MTTERQQKKDGSNAVVAWETYRDRTMAGHPRRQLRRRDFIAGYLKGTEDERNFQQQKIHPAIMTMQSMVTHAELDPNFMSVMWALHPEEMNKLSAFLRGPV